jgi:hypothetical protein
MGFGFSDRFIVHLATVKITTMGKIVDELNDIESLADSFKLSSRAYYRLLAKTLSNLGLFGITYNSLLSTIKDVKHTDENGESVISNNATSNPGKTKHNKPKVERGSYDPANGILVIAGEQVDIIKQQNKKGPQHESKEARLMRLLFSDVNSNFGTTAMRRVVSVRDYDFKPRHRKLVESYKTEINRKVYRETGIKDFLLSNQLAVMINKLYL